MLSCPSWNPVCRNPPLFYQGWCCALKAQIAQDSIIIPDEQTEESERVESVDEIQTDLRQWVTEICEESRSLAAANGGRDNIHFLLEIIPHIIRLASNLPLWTGIMVPLFQSTSITARWATVEAEFKNIKHGLFRHENLPVRVDRFIARHLSFIEGNMRICSAKEKTKDEATVGSLEVTDANSGSMTTRSAEDKNKNGCSPVCGIWCCHKHSSSWWRCSWELEGLAVPPKKRKRTSYFSPCTEWLHAD